MDNTGDNSTDPLGNLSLITNASMFTDIRTRQNNLGKQAREVSVTFKDLLARSKGLDLEQDAELNTLAISYSEVRQNLIQEMREWYDEVAKRIVDSAPSEEQFRRRQRRVHGAINGWKATLAKTTPLGLYEKEEEEDREWLGERAHEFPPHHQFPASTTPSTLHLTSSPNNIIVNGRQREKSKSTSSVASSGATPLRSSTPEAVRNKRKKNLSLRRKSVTRSQKEKVADLDEVFEEEATSSSASADLVAKAREEEAKLREVQQQMDKMRKELEERKEKTKDIVEERKKIVGKQ